MASAVPALEEVSRCDGAPSERKRVRLVGLDVFRGITMAVMLLVDVNGEAYSTIDHAPWDGIHLADFVMPYFLFISGVSASISARQQRRSCRAFSTALARAVRLFAVGLAVQGSLFDSTAEGSVLKFDLSTFRIMGILQRISVMFVLVSLVELFVPNLDVSSRDGALLTDHTRTGLNLLKASSIKWAVILTMVGSSTIVTYCVKPPSSWPGCSSQLYGEPSDYVLHKMGCSSVGWLDTLILGVNHVYIAGSDAGVKAPANFGFDPEGVITTISAVLPMFYGLHVGQVWMSIKDAKPVFRHWLMISIPTLAASCILLCWIPFNKRLWSPSYNLFMCATGTFLYSALFYICDCSTMHESWMAHTPLRLFKATLTPFQWLGSNCILFFVFSYCCGVLPWLLQCLTWGEPASTHNMVYWFQYEVLWKWFHLGDSCTPQGPCGPVLLARTAVEILFWVAVCGLLHRKGIFWKL